MASTIVKSLHNKTNIAGQSGNGDMLSEFLGFKKRIENSGKDPQTMLNELIASGKVSQQQLKRARSLATVFANKFKSGR